jgi:endonuclease/exonuclease/phosphatase family metal-dependent hydrolase
VRRDRLTLVVYNAWFGDFLWQQRLAGLLDVVRSCRPDVVALQEVTRRQLEAILATEWIRQGYWVSDRDGRSLEPHGVLTLSRVPVRDLALCELPSNKHRKLLVAELGLAQGPLVVGNLHLESSARATPLRLAQLDRVLASLRGVGNAIVMGDFNFDPAQAPEQDRLDGHYRDLWDELRPNEAGYTEDTDVNRMRLLHKNKEKQVRFDRILLGISRQDWEPVSIRLIGTAPIAPQRSDLFPSDHFGLAAELAWRGEISPEAR